MTFALMIQKVTMGKITAALAHIKALALICATCQSTLHCHPLIEKNNTLEVFDEILKIICFFKCPSFQYHST